MGRANGTQSVVHRYLKPRRVIPNPCVPGASGVPAEPPGNPNLMSRHGTSARPRQWADSGSKIPRCNKIALTFENILSSRNYGATFPMDSDRKYRQHGYMDSERDSRGPRDDRPKPQGPRPPIDVTGPPLAASGAARGRGPCYNCATTLPEGIEFSGACPKCNADLHCCKQCSHFEPSTRFQCLKPIPVRIPQGQGQRVHAVHAARDSSSRRHRQRTARCPHPPVNTGTARPAQRRRRPQCVRSVV